MMQYNQFEFDDNLMAMDSSPNAQHSDTVVLHHGQSSPNLNVTSYEDELLAVASSTDGSVDEVCPIGLLEGPVCIPHRVSFRNDGPNSESGSLVAVGTHLEAAAVQGFPAIGAPTSENEYVQFMSQFLVASRMLGEKVRMAFENQQSDLADQLLDCRRAMRSEVVQFLKVMMLLHQEQQEMNSEQRNLAEQCDQALQLIKSREEEIQQTLLNTTTIQQQQQLDIWTFEEFVLKLEHELKVDKECTVQEFQKYWESLLSLEKKGAQLEVNTKEAIETLAQSGGAYVDMLASAVGGEFQEQQSVIRAVAD